MAQTDDLNSDFGDGKKKKGSIPTAICQNGTNPIPNNNISSSKQDDINDFIDYKELKRNENLADILLFDNFSAGGRHI